MFSLRQYCLDFPIFTKIDSKFHFSYKVTEHFDCAYNSISVISLDVDM